MFNRVTSCIGTGLFLFAFVGIVEANTLMFDFGEATTPTGSNYNNVTQSQLPIFNALDTTGAGTGIGLTTVGFNPGSNQSGTSTPGGAAAIFDPLATRDNLFGHTVNFNQPAPLPLATLTLSGLDPSGLTAYDFTFFASRMGVTDNREAQYAISGLNALTGYLDSAGNTDNVAVVAGIIPDAAGQVTIDVSPGPNNNNSSGFYYLGAMQIETVAVPEPASLALIALAVPFALVRRRW